MFLHHLILSSNSKIKLEANNEGAIKVAGRKKIGCKEGILIGINGINTIKIEDRERQYLLEEKKNISENIYLLKDSFTVISNLSKNVDNLEVLRIKGFLDVITDKLSYNDTVTLPYLTRYI